MSITFEFEPWGSFLARKRPAAIQSWLRKIADASEAAFKGGMGKYPPASSPGSYPASRSGRLKGSIRTEVKRDSVTIGTNTPYSLFLRHGTSRMARRKMSDNALQEGMRGARLGRWVEWTRT